MNPLARYFDEQEEPIKGCLLYLRCYILDFDPNITESLKYGMPFFSFKGKMCCYLWVDKKLRWPYLGIVEGQKIQHPDLLQERRARMKILLIDPTKDTPVEKMENILNQIVGLYQ